MSDTDQAGQTAPEAPPAADSEQGQQQPLTAVINLLAEDDPRRAAAMRARRAIAELGKVQAECARLGMRFEIVHRQDAQKRVRLEGIVLAPV